jgi:Cof subfamily protein (haloacid dehalogenase superfamily)
MEDIQLIAFDLDGTALTSEKVISPRTRCAFENADKAGKILVPCTGRGKLPDCFDDVPGIPFLVANNGSRVIKPDTGEFVLYRYFEKETAVSLVSQFRTMGCLVYCYCEFGEIIDNIGLGWDVGAVDAIFDRYAAFLNTPKEDLLTVIQRGERKTNTFSVNFLDSAAQQRAFPELINRHDVSVTVSEGRSIEFMPLGTNKGAAIQFLANKLGIDMKNVMAIGDNLNDIEMISNAGYGVAMDNALDSVKEKADWVTASADEDGVALAIERIL